MTPKEKFKRRSFKDQNMLSYMIPFLMLTKKITCLGKNYLKVILSPCHYSFKYFESSEKSLIAAQNQNPGRSEKSCEFKVNPKTWQHWHAVTYTVQHYQISINSLQTSTPKPTPGSDRQRNATTTGEPGPRGETVTINFEIDVLQRT